MRKRLLIVQPNLNPPGGSCGVSAWGIEALKFEYELSILTWKPVNLEAINRFYGTNLSADELRIYCFPSLIRILYRLDPDIDSVQPLALMMRIGKLIRKRFDATISFCDEIDLGEPVIQYIHFPYMSPRFMAFRSLDGLPFWKRFWKFSLRPWRVISGFDFDRMRRNITLVNSDWTGQVTHAAYEMPTTTVYPPVTGRYAQDNWSERENGFVCIGRLSGEKRLEQIIDILYRVRNRGYNIHLHIIGTISFKNRGDSYYLKITKLISEQSYWITFNENLSRDELHDVVARHKYGIHGMKNEHFGMAVAEMTLGGCVVFVPNGGGQTEIVRNDPRLLYDSIDEAVEKITRVLDDEKTQLELQAKLHAHAHSFREDRFMRHIQEMVAVLIQALDAEKKSYVKKTLFF